MKNFLIIFLLPIFFFSSCEKKFSTEEKKSEISKNFSEKDLEIKNLNSLEDFSASITNTNNSNLENKCKSIKHKIFTFDKIEDGKCFLKSNKKITEKYGFFGVKIDFENGKFKNPIYYQCGFDFYSDGKVCKKNGGNNITNIKYKINNNSFGGCFRKTPDIKIIKESDELKKCLYFVVNSDCGSEASLNVGNKCDKDFFYMNFNGNHKKILSFKESIFNFCSINRISYENKICQISNNKFKLIEKNIPSVLEFYSENGNEEKYFISFNGSSVYNIKDKKGYIKLFNKVFYDGKELKMVDYKSFKINENKLFASDLNNLFYKGKIVKDLDLKSYKILNIGHDFFVKDKNFVFFNGEKIQNSDGKSFKILKDGYLTDKNQSYYVNITCAGCGFIIFSKKLELEIFDYGYAKDDIDVYRFGKKIKGADSKTFKIDGSFIHDKFGTYNDNKIKYYYYEKGGKIFYSYNGKRDIPQEIVGADLDSFQVINKDYAKDKNYVYYDNNRINEGDPMTFKFLGEVFYYKNYSTIEYRYSKDKNNVYFFGNKLIDIDASIFSIIGGGFAKDDKNIIWNGKIIKGADIGTFKVINDRKSIAEDKNCRYENSSICIDL